MEMFVHFLKKKRYGTTSLMNYAIVLKRTTFFMMVGMIALLIVGCDMIKKDSPNHKPSWKQKDSGTNETATQITSSLTEEATTDCK